MGWRRNAGGLARVTERLTLGKRALEPVVNAVPATRCVVQKAINPATIAVTGLQQLCKRGCLQRFAVLTCPHHPADLATSVTPRRAFPLLPRGHS